MKTEITLGLIGFGSLATAIGVSHFAMDSNPRPITSFVLAPVCFLFPILTFAVSAAWLRRREDRRRDEEEEEAENLRMVLGGLYKRHEDASESGCKAAHGEISDSKGPSADELWANYLAANGSYGKFGTGGERRDP